MLTVSAVPVTTGAQPDRLPAPSTARNWTAVWPSAVMFATPPAAGALQVVPPSVEVRNSYDATPASASVAPPATTAIDAALCQFGGVMLTVGGAGSVRSMRMVAPAAPPCGPQSEMLPAESVVRNSTSVSPSTPTVTLSPGELPVQVRPPSVEVRYSVATIPDPLGSVDPASVTVTDAPDVHCNDPPAPLGSVGGRRSSMTVLATVGEAGAQGDALPATSSDRNCTTLVPSDEITASEPPAGGDQLTPWLADTRYW
jgi:hypothetical protein